MLQPFKKYIETSYYYIGHKYLAYSEKEETRNRSWTSGEIKYIKLWYINIL